VHLSWPIPLTVLLKSAPAQNAKLLSTGCQWRAIPKDLPPRSTVHDYFDLWAWDGTLDRIHHALYVQCRELANREPSPSAAIIDSQSVKSAEKGGRGNYELNKGETVLDGIERLRRRCRELKADLHRIASAPFPSSTILLRCRMRRGRRPRPR
jgi:Putative transposase of IS4/5 family (DUF4096)